MTRLENEEKKAQAFWVCYTLGFIDERGRPILTKGVECEFGKVNRDALLENQYPYDDRVKDVSDKADQSVNSMHLSGLSSNHSAELDFTDSDEDD